MTWRLTGGELVTTLTRRTLSICWPARDVYRTVSCCWRDTERDVARWTTWRRWRTCGGPRLSASPPSTRTPGRWWSCRAGWRPRWASCGRSRRVTECVSRSLVTWSLQAAWWPSTGPRPQLSSGSGSIRASTRWWTTPTGPGTAPSQAPPSSPATAPLLGALWPPHWGSMLQVTQTGWQTTDNVRHSFRSIQKVGKEWSLYSNLIIFWLANFLSCRKWLEEAKLLLWQCLRHVWRLLYRCQRLCPSWSTSQSSEQNYGCLHQHHSHPV